MRVNASDRQWGKRQDRTGGTPEHAADLTQSQLRQWKAAEQRLTDADPGPRDPCVVAAVDKFTWTTEILWRKRDGVATL